MTTPAAQTTEAVEETEDSASVQNMKMFPWLTYTAGISLCTDNPDKTGNAEKAADGRYIMIQISCVGEEFSWEDVTGKFTMFTLRDSDNNEYDVLRVTSTMKEGGNLDDLEDTTYAYFGVVFDIPTDVALDTLTLLVDTDNENEHITVNMADVPIE